MSKPILPVTSAVDRPPDASGQRGKAPSSRHSGGGQPFVGKPWRIVDVLGKYPLDGGTAV